MKKKLNLNDLEVQSFIVAEEAKVKGGKTAGPNCDPSYNYTDCGSCGIACTSIDPC